MSTTPRLSSSVAGQPASMGSVMGHAPEIMAAFSALYADFWQGGMLSPEIKEMTRIRNARVTDCGY